MSASFQCPLRILSSAFPTTSHTLVIQLMILYSEQGKRERSPFGGIQHSQGSQLLTHQLSFTPQEKSWARKISPDLKLCPVAGKSDSGKVKFSSVASDTSKLFVCSFGWLAGFVFGLKVLEYLFWKPRLPQRLSFLWVIVCLLSRGSQTITQSIWSWFGATAVFIARTVSFLLIPQCRVGLLVYVSLCLWQWVSQLSQRYFRPWLDAEFLFLSEI